MDLPSSPRQEWNKNGNNFVQALDSQNVRTQLQNICACIYVCMCVYVRHTHTHIYIYICTWYIYIYNVHIYIYISCTYRYLQIQYKDIFCISHTLVWYIICTCIYTDIYIYIYKHPDSWPLYPKGLLPSHFGISLLPISSSTRHIFPVIGHKPRLRPWRTNSWSSANTWMECRGVALHQQMGKAIHSLWVLDKML